MPYQTENKLNARMCTSDSDIIPTRKVQNNFIAARLIQRVTEIFLRQYSEAYL